MSDTPKWEFNVIPPADFIESQKNKPFPMTKIGPLTIEEGVRIIEGIWIGEIWEPLLSPINIKEPMMGNWVKFDGEHLDLPQVNFCLKLREARMLVSLQGAIINDTDPQDTETSFYKLLEEKYPELKAGILISFGFNPEQQMLYFGFLHRHLPRTHWSQHPGNWSLLHRCTYCKDPIDMDDGGVELTVDAREREQESDVKYKCSACVKEPGRVGMFGKPPFCTTLFVMDEACEDVETPFEKVWKNALTKCHVEIPPCGPPTVERLPDVAPGIESYQVTANPIGITQMQEVVEKMTLGQETEHKFEGFGPTISNSDTVEKVRQIQERLRKQRGLDK